jgi:hypothetical protein
MVGVPLGAPLFLSAPYLWNDFGMSWEWEWKIREDVLLPVSKWLVAKEPIPLSIPRVAHSVVGVYSVIEVVRV